TRPDGELLASRLDCGGGFPRQQGDALLLEVAVNKSGQARRVDVGTDARSRENHAHRTAIHRQCRGYLRAYEAGPDNDDACSATSQCSHLLIILEGAEINYAAIAERQAARNASGCQQQFLV